MKHANVAVFVPHAGCPQQCSFCNQRSITGQAGVPTAEEVSSILEDAVKNLREKSCFAEIAFFGGSFTAIERSIMLDLLKAAAPYRRQQVFSGIRISTRPDAIDHEILTILKEYGVTAIELGAQSMDDAVLQKNRRGHTAEQVRNASKLIHQAGFSLGLQMMTGLWGDTTEGAVSTAREIAALSPDCVRIYPTVVMKGTELEKRYLSGEYHPMELEQAVELCGDLLTFFHQQAIPVIRLGLHSSPELDQGRVAGPWHPAFRELCESRMLLRRITAFLRQGKIPRGMIQIAVAPSWVSRAVGQSRCNLASLGQMGYQARVIQDAAIAPSDFQIFCQTQPESR